MNSRSNVRDLTHIARMAEPSPEILLMYLCGTAKTPHKGGRLGGIMRGRLPMVCPACVASRAVSKVAA